MTLTNLRLDIEYDGTGFAGWARQPGLETIEAALMQTLARILQQPVRLTVAGRTDAGVHARGQVASFSAAGEAIDCGKFRRSLNQLLPDAIAVKQVSPAAADFDARRSARSRTYSYSVLNRPWPSVFRRRFVYYYPGSLDLDLLGRAALLALGRHDFTAFTPAVSEHCYFEREIAGSGWRREGDLLVYTITASSFLRNMVRVLVGTMLEIGRGYRPLDSLAGLLDGAGRPDAGTTAPPGGLCLEEVQY